MLINGIQNWQYVIIQYNNARVFKHDITYSDGQQEVLSPLVLLFDLRVDFNLCTFNYFLFN